nr:N-acetylneuraminate synthase [Aquibacillus albus]
MTVFRKKTISNSLVSSFFFKRFYEVNVVNKPYIQIGNRKIGEEYAPLVIAEIGINHEGSLEVAKEMVDAAYSSGAEIIKHQTHVIEDEMSKEAKRVIPGNTDVSIYDVMSKCALNEKDEIALKDYVESKGMIYLSTPFSRKAANRLERMGVSAYKVGSGECNNYPLIEHIASYGKPMIVSTGMNDISSINKTVEILENYNIQFALLHCTNLYPTPPSLVRLGGMQELQDTFPNAVIGLSDHTANNNACLAATALGASILERHFTDSKNRTGPDILCSMDPKELKDLIEGSSEIAQMRGGKKEPTKEEQVTINFAFATVVAIQDIKAGEILSEENIWVKRPGIGEIKAEHYKSIIGKKVIKDISNDEHLSWNDIER